MTQPRTTRGASLDAPALSTPWQQPSGLPNMAVFVLGHPVSANRMYAGRKPSKRNAGTRRLTQEADAWRGIVITDCRTWLAEQRWNIQQPPILWRLPLAVRVTVYNVRGDADNYAKLVLDGLSHALGYDRTTGALLIDDRNFNPVTIARAAGRVRGCLIEVWQAPEAEAA